MYVPSQKIDSIRFSIIHFKDVAINELVKEFKI